MKNQGSESSGLFLHKRVERAHGDILNIPQHMSIDHRSLNALMPEQGLDLPYVNTLHQKVGGEAVAEGVDGIPLTAETQRTQRV